MATKLDWLAIFDALGPDAEGCFHFLLHLADGRPSFEMRLVDMIPLVASISPERFNGLCLRLVEAGLVTIAAKKNGCAIWTILQRPPSWKPVNMSGGRKFHIPVENHFSRKRLT
jgi:hypothetical protein